MKLKQIIAAVLTAVITFSVVALPESSPNGITMAADISDYCNDETLWGDINLDGGVDIADVMRLDAYLLNPAKFPIGKQAMYNADTVLDRVIDTSDSTRLFNYLNMLIYYESLGYIDEMRYDNDYYANYPVIPKREYEGKVTFSTDKIKAKKGDTIDVNVYSDTHGVDVKGIALRVNCDDRLSITDMTKGKWMKNAWKNHDSGTFLSHEYDGTNLKIDPSQPILTVTFEALDDIDSDNAILISGPNGDPEPQCVKSAGVYPEKSVYLKPEGCIGSYDDAEHTIYHPDDTDNGVTGVKCTEEMFNQSSTDYHKDISLLSVSLSAVASDSKGTSYLTDAYEKLGFKNVMTFSYLGAPSKYKFDYKEIWLSFENLSNEKKGEIFIKNNIGRVSEEGMKALEYCEQNQGTIRYKLVEVQPFAEDTLAFSIATREFGDSVLVAFNLRGTKPGTYDESVDIQFVGEEIVFEDGEKDTVHGGFSSFYDKVLTGWECYLRKYKGYFKNAIAHDKDIKYLFTGHSLGGASAGLCALGANHKGFSIDDTWVSMDHIYAYTYAAPNQFTSNFYGHPLDYYAENILNVTQANDPVPTLPFDFLWVDYVRFGRTLGFLDQYSVEKGDWENHNIGHYIVGVQNNKFTEYNGDISDSNAKKVVIGCPVDVDVYFRGELVGQVKDEKINEEVTRIPIIINENCEKALLIPDTRDYKVKITAYDDGDMKVWRSGTAIEEIELNKDKQFSYDINKEKEPVLTVLDENGNKAYRVEADGSEVPYEPEDPEVISVTDVNNDGFFNVTDVVMFRKLIMSGYRNSDCIIDLNDDGRMNVFDFILMKRKLLGN